MCVCIYTVEISIYRIYINICVYLKVYMFIMHGENRCTFSIKCSLQQYADQRHQRCLQSEHWMLSVYLVLFSCILFTVTAVNAQSNDFVSAASSSSSSSSNMYSSYSESINHHIFPAVNEFSTHTVIKPQMHHALHKREIQSTLDVNGLHLPHVVLTYYHRGQRIVIDLKRNDPLLPETHFLRYQNSNSSNKHDTVVKHFTKTDLALCHYQGSIRNKPLSYAAVSTCSGGINGIVFDGVDTYFINSAKSGQLHDDHLLFSEDNILHKNTSCGYDVDGHEEERPTKSNHIPEMKVNRLLRYKRSFGDSQVIRGPFNSNKHSSYVELVIVVDNKAYKSFGENMKKVHQHCKDLANIINALYVPLNIFIALVGVVIWNESNEIEITPDADDTLRNFLIYRRTKLVLEHPNDNAQLLTKVKFEKGVVGKALKGPICTHEFSGSVSMEHSQIVAVVATTMAHELGHNFGMEHDSPDCKCQDEKCIMSASSTSVVPVHWSSCSVDQLNIAFSRGMNYCLRNKPIKLFDSPQCGNGFVEPGEQCDCGLPAYCENTCCDPHTCMLHSNASCATGECCDLMTCRPKGAGTLCRNDENECDLPEYCTGESEYCPIDVYKRDTVACDNGHAFCYQGNCRSHSHQCRILWGPTGENSEPCYLQMNTQGKRGGNCGINRFNNTFIPCDVEHVACGMLHCRHLNERLEFGMESAAVLSHSFISHENNIVPCRTALVDLGLQSSDPGLAPNGAKCGNDKMCINQKCVAVEYLRSTGMGKSCPEDCNGNGVCNSRGNCHCNIGFTGATCMMPGHGGSVDSGPATNPNSHEAFQRFLYIFLFAVIPFMAAFCFVMYYCRNHPLLAGGKLAENIIKTTNSTKQTAGGPNSAASGNGLPKSTPSSTDDMNSALLKSSSDSNDVSLGNGMFGKFKGFTLRPLNDAITPSSNFNASNVAYVQPTFQDNGLAVPQRAAPPPPLKQNNETLTRKAPPPPTTVKDLSNLAPALPPPNPSSNARPIISMPVLENSTLTMTLSNKTDMTPSQASLQNAVARLKAAPAPPVPLHTDPKLNVQRDGTIRRIASFLKKESGKPAPPMKEKTYIDREKLRTLEISAPIAVSNKTATSVPLGESSNSDSETTTLTLKEEETKNLVKRAQSMRSPSKKNPIQTFGSMRQSNGMVRPKSSVSTQGSLNSAAASRPKSPPPRPPPALKKTNSTTSSGYQMPVTPKRSQPEHMYDDCEFAEQPQHFVKTAEESNVFSSSKGMDCDNIYSVIDDIRPPPAADTLKRSDLISSERNSITSGCDLGLLNEIVNEIEKRNGGNTVYSATNLVNTKAPLPELAKAEENPHKVKFNINKINQQQQQQQQPEQQQKQLATMPILNTAPSSSYLRSTAINTPVARVAPTRSDLNTLTSFKPPTTVQMPGKLIAVEKPSIGGIKVVGVQNKKHFDETKNSNSTKKIVGNKQNTTATNGKPAATIQKPKLLSTKPSFSSNPKRNIIASKMVVTTVPVSTTTTTATTTTTTTNKPSSTVAAMTQRFENTTNASLSNHAKPPVTPKSKPKTKSSTSNVI